MRPDNYCAVLALRTVTSFDSLPQLISLVAVLQIVKVSALEMILWTKGQFDTQISLQFGRGRCAKVFFDPIDHPEYCLITSLFGFQLSDNVHAFPTAESFSLLDLPLLKFSSGQAVTEIRSM